MKAKAWMFTLLLGLALLAAIPVVAQQPAGPAIYFYHDGQATPVTRTGVLGGDVQADAETLLRALLAGPTPGEKTEGFTSPLPAGAELAAATVAGQRVTVDLRLPLDFLQDKLDAGRSDAIVEQIVKTLHPLGLYHIVVRAQDLNGDYLPLSEFLPRPILPAPTVPPNEDAAPEYIGQPPSVAPGRPQGALSGKTVWLSAGHGWYWSDTLNRWNSQRPNTYGIVEDFSNAEAVNYYLARYLWNAGADVWLVRERSMNEHEVIVDNDDGAPTYTETGSWATSSTPGYQGGTYRWSTTFADLTATATWTPDLPAAGWYAVWAWYREGVNRPTDARYEIHHAGGVTTVHVSQEVHGRTWRYLGEYYFADGTSGHVTLLNQSADPAQAVIADAIRFGGGLGSIVAPGGTSGEPRWEEAAKYWAEYQGAPVEILDSDVTARPLYAEWESAKGYPGEAENAVYISWHTNAGGGTGTDSFIHSTEPTTGSADLQDWVHAELIADLRAAWDPAWVNRGQKSADFGELRELSVMPGVLLEVAFHDTEDPGDADDLREPVFRQIAARAVFQGIVKYHAERDGALLPLLPEPPQRLAARSSGPGQVTLTWTPPPCCDGVVGDAATGYKVYQSADGRGFDAGLETNDTTLTLTGLVPGELRFFRVTALNAGGESFPTPVVAVRTPPDGTSPAFLIVDGFDRLDQTALIPQWESPALGTAQRMFLERMHRYDYAVEHAQALATCGLAFDSAVNEAVEAGDVALAAYPAVDWFAGENSVADQSLSDTERALLAAYLDGGGGLLISGSEIGFDLVEYGRDPDFYHDYLRAAYLGDDAGTYGFAGAPGGIFAGLAGTFDDSTQGTYDVGYPDRLAASNGSAAAATYTGGTNDSAAVVYGGAFRLVHFGFPLETVTDPDTRTVLFCAAADHLLPAGPAGVALSPDRSRLAEPGQVITYSHTLTNTGQSPDTFHLNHASSQDWPVAYASPIALGGQQTATLVVSITVPAEALSGTVDTVRFTATSQFDPAIFATVTDTTRVGQVAGVDLYPDRTGSATGGQVVSYRHTLANAGNGTDTFHLGHASSQGWPVSHPLSLTLSAGATQTLLVSVTVPVTVTSLALDTTVVTAASQVDPMVFVAVSDTTTANRVLGISLVPDRHAAADPGQTVVYSHTLTNSGNVSDSFQIAHQNDHGWAVSYTSPFTLSAGQAATLAISVTVPAEAVSGTVATTVLTATSQTDPSISDAVSETTVANQLAGVAFWPSHSRTVEPGTVVTYSHTLANQGNGPDVFDLSHASSQGWSMVYPSPLPLDSGQTQTFVVSITVPADAPSDTVDVTMFTATAQSEPDVQAVVSDTTVVLRQPVAPPLQTPRLINPGFEGGLGQSAWKKSTPDGSSPFTHLDDLPIYVEPHRGDWLAWLRPSGEPTATTVLTQVVGLPGGEPTARLTLAWFAHPEISTPAAGDELSVSLYDAQGVLLADLLVVGSESLTDTWQMSELDVSEFAGQIVQVVIRATAGDTHFFVDDVNLLTSGPPAPDEFRAFWVDAYHVGVKSQAQIDELVETAQAGNFNALVVQVRRRGDTYYPSALDPWAPDADRSFDALAYLIDRAHSAGIQVHAWGAALAIWGGSIPPLAPDHVFYEHGPGVTGRDYWLMTSYSGEEQPGNQLYYLDPGHPDAVDYTVAIYAELAANYDLDGLHLDRIRYPEHKGIYCQSQVWYCQDWGYNPTAVARFQAQTGRSDVPEPLDAQWVQWRRDQVTALMRRVYLTVTAINPRLRVSAATVTSGGPPSATYPWETRTPYIHHLQDWRGWLEEGIVDLALPMTYRDEATYASQFDGWIEWQKNNQYGRGTVVGTGLYLNTAADSMAQWLRARQTSALGNSTLGVCGYSYASPSDEGVSRRGFANVTVTEVFTRSASVPAIPWKDTPTLGHLAGTVNPAKMVNQAPPCPLPTGGYTLTLTGPQSRYLVSDGSGWFGAVDLPPGDYVLEIEPLRPSKSLSLPLTVTAGVVTDLQVPLPGCLPWTSFLPIVVKQGQP